MTSFPYQIREFGAQSGKRYVPYIEQRLGIHQVVQTEFFDPSSVGIITSYAFLSFLAYGAQSDFFLNAVEIQSVVVPYPSGTSSHTKEKNRDEDQCEPDVGLCTLPCRSNNPVKRSVIRR